MKVLLINITGRAGSTGKIINDIRDFLISNNHDAVIAHGHPDVIAETGFFQVDTRIESVFVSQLTKMGRATYKGNPFALNRIKKIVKDYNPDIVHIHCINGMMCNIYKLFKYLADSHIKTVITHHAEFFYTGSCGYSLECTQWVDNQCKTCPNPRKATRNWFWANPHKNWVRMFDAIHRFDETDVTFVSVSPWGFQQSMKSPIVKDYPAKVVLNGIDTEIFHYRELEKESLFPQTEIKNKMVLHVTSMFSSNDRGQNIKGGGFVIDLALKMPDVTFVVVAFNTNIVTPIPDNVVIWGQSKNQYELARLYSMADVTLLTSKKETFSMVVAESLCCGTPVVGFKAGAPEMIGLSEYCEFSEYGDIQLLSENLHRMLNSSFDKRSISRSGDKRYSRSRMGEDYLSIYQQMLSE